MAATEQVFIYNFGSRRGKKPNLVSIPLELGIPHTAELSILHFNVWLDEKVNMASIPGRPSAVETRQVTNFD